MNKKQLKKDLLRFLVIIAAVMTIGFLGDKALDYLLGIVLLILGAVYGHLMKKDKKNAETIPEKE
jgi:Ca2+/Na+ antiporter